MAINIKFDLAGNPEPPTILLANKNGNILGQLNVDEESIDISDKFNDASEFSFTLNKFVDDEITNLWDKVVNFKLVYCEEWDMWFEITVELDEETETVKTVFCTQLGQAELSQLKLYNVEINTESDIARDDYKITILYDENDHEASLLHRLLKDKAPHYSIIYVDPTIAKLQRSFSFDDTSICDAFMEIAEEIGCLFVFHSNSKNGKIQRTISVFDLQQNCLNPDCKHRGEFTDVCPKCGGQDKDGNKYGIEYGYGEDTKIFVTSDELASGGIQLKTDTDAVKNCFKLEAGDDLMTATVRNCNPNGTDYIWRFSDDMKSDMSEELKEALKAYDLKYKEYCDTYKSELDKDLVKKYNALVEKYKNYYDTKSTCLNCKNEEVFDGNCPKCGSSNVLSGDSLQPIPNEIIGYAPLMNAYYDTIDFALYLESSLMPDVDLTEKSLCSDCKYEGVFKNTCPQCGGTNILSGAEYQASLLTTSALSTVAVKVDNVEGISLSTSNTSVLSMAKVIVKSTYKVEIKTSSLSEDKIWTGSFIVTNYSDENDTAESGTISVIVNNDTETYVEQLIEKSLNKDNTNDYSVTGLFEKELIVIDKEIEKINAEIEELDKRIEEDPYNTDLLEQKAEAVGFLSELILLLEDGNEFGGEFYDELKKYALNPLKSFYDACDACLNILIEQGAGSENEKPDLYENLYNPYRQKSSAISNEIALREEEINLINGISNENGVVDPKGIKQNIESCRNSIQDELNFQTCLGEELWLEFCCYRREDKYSNENYASDGLNNAELFKKASEFFEVAENEIFKASEHQHSISTTLNNLLAIPKFKELIKYFNLGNWIRVQIDDNVYRLRLLEYGINFGDFDNVDVEFSDVTKIKNGVTDVQAVLSQASSMATSYSSVKRQASQGEKSNTTLNDWVKNGLSATNTKIVSGVDESILLGKNGFWCRQIDPVTGEVSNEQIKIFDSTIAITDDKWNTTKTAIGKYYYIDENGEEKMAYGVNGETIIGKFILGKNLSMQSESGAMKFDGDGLSITSGTGDSVGTMTFNENGLVVNHGKNTVTISPKTEEVMNITNGEDEVFEVNENGELSINGNIIARSLKLENGVKIDSGVITNLANVATSGSYYDLLDAPTKLSEFNNDSGFITNSVNNLTNYYNKTETNNLLNKKANSDDLADVATSGSYDDLSNKPNLKAVATSGSYNDLSNKPSLSSVATSGSYNDLVDIDELKNWVLQQIQFAIS